MKKRYIVQHVEGLDGIEFLADSPHHRRIYGPGEIVELDSRIHNIPAILGSGQLREYVEPVNEPVIPATATAEPATGKATDNKEG